MTSDAQVGGQPCAEAGNAGTEVGDAQVGGGPHVGVMSGLGLGTAGWYDGDGSGDRG